MKTLINGLRQHASEIGHAVIDKKKRLGFAFDTVEEGLTLGHAAIDMQGEVSHQGIADKP